MASSDQDEETMSISGTTLSVQRITVGVSEILSLLRTLGEGCRLSYMYRCQVKHIVALFKILQRSGELTQDYFIVSLVLQEALDTYMKLPHKHYNTGWVLSQVISDFFFSFRLSYMHIAWTCFILTAI